MRESTSFLLSALEVLYTLSTDSRESGIHKPPCLTLWPMICQKFGVDLLPPEYYGEEFLS